MKVIKKYHQLLSGDWLMVGATRLRVFNVPRADVRYIQEEWSAFFSIGRTKKRCRSHFTRAYDCASFAPHPITGRDGLRGLVVGHKMLLGIMSEIEARGKRCMFLISGFDERRNNVYRYFLRHPGFQEYFHPTWRSYCYRAVNYSFEGYKVSFKAFIAGESYV